MREGGRDMQSVLGPEVIYSAVKNELLVPKSVYISLLRCVFPS